MRTNLHQLRLPDSLRDENRLRKKLQIINPSVLKALFKQWSQQNTSLKAIETICNEQAKLVCKWAPIMEKMPPKIQDL